MLEMYYVWLHDNFYEEMFDFENQILILLEECFMLNISCEVHSYIILCYVVISQKRDNTHTNYIFQISIIDFYTMKIGPLYDNI